MNLSLRKNITIKEIECKCGCGLSSISSASLDIVQDARDHFKKPVVVHSACRCKNHNKAVGGKKKSKHQPLENKTSRAIDFHIKGVTIGELYSYLFKKYPNCLGLGKYKSFVHIDDRMDRAYRWDLR